MAVIQEHAKQKIKEIVKLYEHEPTPLLIVLSHVQEEFGYIPLEVQELISEEMNIPVAEIYGVVTFYSFFSLKPKGKYIIGVCLGTACYVKGGQNVISKFCDLLKIKPGETTPDGLFTVDALRCIGACAIAPAVIINGKVYANVSVKQVENILKEYESEAN